MLTFSKRKMQAKLNIVTTGLVYVGQAEKNGLWGGKLPEQLLSKNTGLKYIITFISFRISYYLVINFNPNDFQGKTDAI